MSEMMRRQGGVSGGGRQVGRALSSHVAQCVPSIALCWPACPVPAKVGQVVCSVNCHGGQGTRELCLVTPQANTLSLTRTNRENMTKYCEIK